MSYSRVLITGASAGLGASIATHFAEIGYKNLALVARRGQLLSEVEKQCRAKGAENVVILERDLSKPEEVCKGIIDEAVKGLGGLDVLIHNAGLLGNSAMVSQYDDAEVDKVMKVNFNAPILLSKYAIPHLQQSKGTILFLSSIAGTVPSPGAAVYSGSKAAIAQFAKNLALEEAGNGIRVNIISPGFIATDLFKNGGIPVENLDQVRGMMGPCQPLGRVGEDIEIAKLAAFLASKDNAFMTGSEILADGGASLTSSIAAKSAEIYTAMQQAAAKGGK